MKTFEPKYTKGISKLLLFAYFLFLVFTIFHFHPINLNAFDYKISQTNNSHKGYSDLSLDGNLICQLQQFTSSMLKLGVNSKDILSNKSDDFFILRISNQKFYSNKYLTHLQLRAPPTFC